MPGDDDHPVAVLAGDDVLQQTHLPDRVRERREVLVGGGVVAGVVRVGSEVSDGDEPSLGAGKGRPTLARTERGRTVHGPGQGGFQAGSGGGTGGDGGLRRRSSGGVLVDVVVERESMDRVHTRFAAELGHG